MKKENKNINLVRVDHVWSVLCGNSSVDQTSQNISLFSVFEQLNLKGADIESQRKPGTKILVPVNFQLVTLLRKIGKGSFEGSIKTEILSPEGDTLATAENEIKFEAEKDRWRFLASFPGMPITTQGYYEFKVSLKAAGGQYDEKATIPLQVVFN
jgi:hypothetical protein